MNLFRKNLPDIGLALAILAFSAIGIVSYVSALQLSDACTSATDSLQILETIARFDSNLSQIEEVAAKFALTGSEKFSKGFEEQMELKKRIIKHLRILTENKPEYRESLDRVESLMNHPYDEVAKVMLVRQQAGNAGQQSTESSNSALETEQIRKELNKLSIRESKALENSLKREAHSTVISKKITITGTVGGLIAMVFVIVLLKRDIGARKLVEAELVNQQEELVIQHELMTELISHIPDSVYVKDAKGRFTIANRACRKKLTGSEDGDIIGKTVFDFMTPRAAEEADMDDETVIRSKRPFIDRVTRVVDMDGKFRWWVSSKVPLFDASGCFTELLGIQRDITEMRNAQEETQKNEGQAKAAAELKNDLLAELGFEIKASLNGIFGMADLMLDTELSPRQRQFIMEARNSAQAILDIFNQKSTDLPSLPQVSVPDTLRIVDQSANPAANKAMIRDYEYQMAPVQNGAAQWNGSRSEPFTKEEFGESLPMHSAISMETKEESLVAAEPKVVISTFDEIVERIGPADFVRMLIRVFLDDTPKMIKELEEAVSAGDAERIRRSAHALKGSLGNFGAKTAMEMAHVLEFAGKTEKLQKQEIGMQFEVFFNELMRVMHALSAYT